MATNTHTAQNHSHNARTGKSLLWLIVLAVIAGLAYYAYANRNEMDYTATDRAATTDGQSAMTNDAGMAGNASMNARQSTTDTSTGTTQMTPAATGASGMDDSGATATGAE